MRICNNHEHTGCQRLQILKGGVNGIAKKRRGKKLLRNTSEKTRFDRGVDSGNHDRDNDPDFRQNTGDMKSRAKIRRYEVKFTTVFAIHAII